MATKKSTSTTTKKRSTLKQTSLLTPPKNFDHSKYAGRWVSEARLSARSDGYEPRGYSVWKNPENEKEVKAGDLVWCYKTKEEALADKQALFEAARDQRRDIASADKELSEKVDFELRQMGGGLQSNIEFEE